MGRDGSGANLCLNHSKAELVQVKKAHEHLITDSVSINLRQSSYLIANWMAAYTVPEISVVFQFTVNEIMMTNIKYKDMNSWRL